MKKSRMLSAACTCLLFASYNSSAALLSGDWKAPGDGLITIDTATGLSWLDLSESAAMPYDDVLAQLGGGGLFDGMRYATDNEVMELWQQLLVPMLPGGAGNVPGEDARINTAASLLGYSLNNASERSILGIAAEYLLWPPGPGWHEPIGMSYDISSNRTFIFTPQNTTSVQIPDGLALPNVSSYLVIATSEVPILPTVWLFGSGLLGLAGMARRKKAA